MSMSINTYDGCEDLPINDENLSTILWIVRLADFGGNGYVIKDAETHGAIGFSMVSWRSDDGYGVLHQAGSYCSGDFDRSSCRQPCICECGATEVDGVKTHSHIDELFLCKAFSSLGTQLTTRGWKITHLWYQS